MVLAITGVLRKASSNRILKRPNKKNFIYRQSPSLLLFLWHSIAKELKDFPFL